MENDFLKDSLFCPFSSTKENGLGLGVYTMSQVANLHGGTVRIASAPGMGTRVRFHFPVEEG
jgi:nitrogen-specific signal transduction histidine kinase